MLLELSFLSRGEDIINKENIHKPAARVAQFINLVPDARLNSFFDLSIIPIIKIL